MKTPYYIRAIFSLSILITVSQTAETVSDLQFNKESNKIIQKVDHYLKEKNSDLKNLKNILLSGKVNGLLSS